MSRFPSGFWGPSPRWAIVPLLGVGLVLAGVAVRRSGEAEEAVAVTALKPVVTAEDGEETVGSRSPVGESVSGMPIEVRYGVPSPRTARLWAEPRPS